MSTTIRWIYENVQELETKEVDHLKNKFANRILGSTPKFYFKINSSGAKSDN